MVYVETPFLLPSSLRGAETYPFLYSFVRARFEWNVFPLPLSPFFWSKGMCPPSSFSFPFLSKVKVRSFFHLSPFSSFHIRRRGNLFPPLPPPFCAIRSEVGKAFFFFSPFFSECMALSFVVTTVKETRFLSFPFFQEKDGDLIFFPPLFFFFRFLQNEISFYIPRWTREHKEEKPFPFPPFGPPFSFLPFLPLLFLGGTRRFDFLLLGDASTFFHFFLTLVNAWRATKVFLPLSPHFVSTGFSIPNPPSFPTPVATEESLFSLFS